MALGNSLSLSKVSFSGSAEQIACRVYRDPSDRRVDLFKAINFPDGGVSSARTGRSLIIPHTADYGRGDMLSLRDSAQRMNIGQPVLTQGNIGVYNSSWDVLDMASRFDGTDFAPSNLDIASGVADGYIGGVQNSLLQIQKNLKAIENLYATQVPVGVGRGTARSVLMSDGFRASRAAHEAAIKNSLTLINRDLIFGRGAGNNMRNSLGLGKSSVSINAARGKDFFPKLHRADARVTNLLGKTKLVGNGMAALNLGNIGYETVASYKENGLEEGAKTLAVKSAGTAAGMKTGAVVAAVIFGAGTGGVGYIVLGIAAVAVSSFAASKATEIAVEKTIDVTNDSIERMIWSQ